MTGETISHFKVLEKLGGGGMGVVYLAENLRLGSKVALKFLPPHLATDEEAKQRFVQEAQAASALNHANICTVHDIDETDDGQLFIAMAHYEGETLKKKLERGPLATKEAADIARQVAEGLAAAHEQGIIHRDIKPANIIVTDDGRAVVLDFGLAKLAGAVDLTKSGSTLGTVFYMSPEQARGEPTGPEADIWALGLVLYEMVTGQRPFVGEYDQAVVYAILNEEPAPVESVRPDVSPGVARLINQALAKDPTARPASMGIIRDELRTVGSPSVAARPNALDLLKSPWAIAAAIVVVAVAAILFMRWNERRSEIAWARQEALPAIAQLVENDEWSKAYALAERAEKIITDDSMLVRLWPEMSRIVSFSSDPEGARILRQEYSDEDSLWVEVGTSPIDSMRHPYGVWKFRLEKDGYLPAFRTLPSSFIASTNFVLDAEGSAPEGMVRVEGGETGISLPGLDHLKPETLGDYWLGKFEVTNREYKAFLDEGGYQNPEYWKYPFVRDGREIPHAEALSQFVDRTGRPGPSTWSVGDYPDGQEGHPVSGVSWYEAAAFARYKGMRLPTMYHWVRAAGTAGSSLIVPRSNFDGAGTEPVGHRSGVGPYGTLDMAGNVREWCENETDTGRRFILGGGWNDETYTFNDANAHDPFNRSPTNGIRLLKLVDAAENLANASRVVPLPFRDYWKEKPVSDQVFAIFRNMYRYDQTDLDSRIEATDDSHPDWRREKVSFRAAYGSERVTAYIYIPTRGQPPYQTAVFFPGSSAIHAESAEEAGLQLGAYDFIIKSGRAVVFPIYKSTYERGDELDSDYPAPTAFYRDHVIMWAKDLARSIDYLETRPEFDTKKLAYYGLSWGGALGGIMPAVESRIKVVVLYVAGLFFQHALPEADPVNFVPRITQPVLMLNGKYDHYFPVETSQKPMFELLGTPPDQKRQIIHESGHFVPRDELVRETLAWLDQYLGPAQ